MTADDQLVVDDVARLLSDDDGAAVRTPGGRRSDHQPLDDRHEDDEPASLTAARQLADESRTVRRLRRGLPERRPGAHRR